MITIISLRTGRKVAQVSTFAQAVALVGAFADDYAIHWA